MSQKPVFSFWTRLVRIIFYAVFLLIVAQILMLDAEQSVGDLKFSESSWTETSQQTFVLITALLFIVLALLSKEHRGLAFLAAAFFSMAFVREFNNYLGEGIFTGGWQTYTILVGGILGFLAYKNRKGFYHSTDLMFHHSGFGLLTSGVLVTFFFSRLYGRGDFWKTVMEERYFRTVKNASEEGIELLGYSLILIGTIELLIYLVRNPKPSGTAEP
ncbi:MAG: hypothetical protein AAF363_09260 [Bacteroidota bacterium]